MFKCVWGVLPTACSAHPLSAPLGILAPGSSLGPSPGPRVRPPCVGMCVKLIPGTRGAVDPRCASQHHASRHAITPTSHTTHTHTVRHGMLAGPRLVRRRPLMADPHANARVSGRGASRRVCVDFELCACVCCVHAPALCVCVLVRLERSTASGRSAARAPWRRVGARRAG